MKTVDLDTIKQIARGDLKAFESLFREYYQMLCSYAMRFVSDTDTAEEIIQDLYYTIWEKRMSLQINSSVKSYLYTAVHNRCLKFIEHKNVETKYRNYYMQNETEIDNQPLEIANVNELHRLIDQTLDSLPERCSNIFRLNRFEGLKYHEIAVKLSISIKTVEANMGKALKLLRKNLKDYVEVA
jgi:RNA polymerase sigma-70 factor, ECF subfamily